MDLTRMLENCRRDQWSVADLDWSKKPRPMSLEDEQTIVQLFTDMAGIERLAGALFREQEKRTDDPTLNAIFRSFVVDELRHAHAAERLASYYDVHRVRTYRQSESLTRFAPPFVEGITYLADDVANAYITAGELMLDIALLRSINDYVHDDMSEQAMRLINRDESRHIAIDYYMIEYYAGDAYLAKLRSRRTSARETAKAWWTFANIVYAAKPFFQDVFFQPMERIDDSGRRLREALRRFQLLGSKPGVKDRPFGKFLFTLQGIYMHPVAGPLLGRLVARLAGVEPRFMGRLNSEDDLARAATMSYDALAEEALAVKSQDD